MGTALNSTTASTDLVTYRFGEIQDRRSSVPDVGDIVGGYQLKWLLGTGGAGQVWLGEHVISKTQGAVKILRATASDTLRRMFLSEARTIARLAHPHIVSLFTHGRDYLVTAYVEGEHLGATLTRPLCPADAIAITLRVGSALAYAHGKGVIHRDVKPENIMVDRRGNPFLTDFGLAALARSAGSGLELGTPAYQPPDHAQAGSGEPADQYALGRTLAEMLLARRIPTHSEVTRTGLPDDLPEKLLDVVMRANSPRARDRYPSVRAFVDDLRQVEAGSLAAPRVLSQRRRSSQPFAWLEAGTAPVDCGLEVWRADYTLSGVCAASAPGDDACARFRADTGLADTGWTVYGRADCLGPVNQATALGRASQVVVLLPGLGCKRQLWDTLARHLCRDHAHTVVISLDLNQSGDCRYAAAAPELHHVSPLGIMRQVSAWRTLLGVSELPTCLVGHSLTAYQLMAPTDAELGKHVTRLAITPVFTYANEVWGGHPLMSLDELSGQTENQHDAVKAATYEFITQLLDEETSRGIVESAVASFPLAFWKQSVKAQETFRPPIGNELRRCKIVVAHDDPIVPRAAVEQAVADLGFDRANLHWALDRDHFPHLPKRDNPEWTARNLDQLSSVIGTMLLDARARPTPAHDSDLDIGGPNAVTRTVLESGPTSK